jgi:hypothetical protein
LGDSSRSLAWFSGPVSLIHAPSLVDSITTTPEFRFSVHTTHQISRSDGSIKYAGGKTPVKLNSEQLTERSKEHGLQYFARLADVCFSPTNNNPALSVVLKLDNFSANYEMDGLLNHVERCGEPFARNVTLSVSVEYVHV